MPRNPDPAPETVEAFRQLIRSRVSSPQRLRAVAATGLLDTAAEEPFDRLADLAATVLGTAWAFVTVVDDARSYWKACAGLGELDVGGRQNHVDESFCQYVVAVDDTFLVDDARSDARTADNPSVGSMGVVAWAGSPIRSADGEVVGTVCVVHDQVRRWSSADARTLEALAAIAGDEIRLRAALEDVDRSTARLAELAVQAARSQAILGTAVDRAPIGFALFDTELRFVAVNEALATTNGSPAGEHLGRRIADVAPGLAGAAEPMLRQVLDTGVPMLDVERTGETPAQPGVVRHWSSSYYRIETPHEVVGVAALITETTVLRLQERRLRQVMDSLLAFVTLTTPDGTILEANRTALDAGGVDADDVRGLALWEAAWWGHTDAGRVALRQALGRAAAGEVVRYDAEVRLQSGRRTTIDLQLVPLVEGGRVTAVVAAGMDISERLAVRRRTERLAQLARGLTCAAATAEAVEVIHREGAAVVAATRADVALLDRQRGVLQVLAGEAADRPAVELGVDDEHLLSHTVRTRQVTVARHPRGGQAVDGSVEDPATTAAAPLLRADGTVFGAIGFDWSDVVPDAALTRSAVEAVADLCAQTLDRTLHADASHDLVDTLQRELLSVTPEITGLEVAVRYQPAARELGFGGDWYEVVPLGGSRTAIIVGDVAGHGVPAAARMAQVRTVLSTLVQLVPDPGVLFDQAERLIDRGSRPLFATVSITIVDTERRELVALSAGHPPSLVVEPSGRACVLRPAHRPLLGIAGATPRPEPVPFPPGSLLVSYTDGLVERRGESIDDGIERLRARLEDLAAEPVDALADGLLRSLLGPDHADDAALAVVRHRP